MSNPAHQQRLSELTQKIAEAVPEIKQHDFCGEHGECDRCGWRKEERMDCFGRPITLEDVLRVLPIYPWFVSAVDRNGNFILSNPEWGATLQAKWNLGKPLSEQSEETISFLHSILCV